MKLLEQAFKLFDEPITLDSFFKLDELYEQATGTEQEYIGELEEALFVACPNIEEVQFYALKRAEEEEMASQSLLTLNDVIG
jgi:hypothetical protein